MRFPTSPLSPLALALALPLLVPTTAIAQTQEVFLRETFSGSRLENVGGTLPDGTPIRYRITSSLGQGPSNNQNFSQSVCLTASQDTSNSSLAAIDQIPGCAPGLSGLPSTGDTPGNGALRLTSNRRGYLSQIQGGGVRDISGQGERGSFIIDTPFPRNRGLKTDFDFFIYNGETNAPGILPPSADGISFFLLDGATSNPTPGAFGGSLGYGPSVSPTGDGGAPGGFIGIGLDAFGNFSVPLEGRRPGGPGFSPDSIVLRGSASQSYSYITGVRSNNVIGRDIDNPATIGTNTLRSGVQGKRVRIKLSQDGILTLLITTNTNLPSDAPDSAFTTVFSNLNLNDGLRDAANRPTLAPLPPTFKFGFAASTGFSTAIHEIRNFVVSPIVPSNRNLRLVKRVTAVIRKGVRTEFNQFTDDPNSTIDNLPGWSQPGASPVGLVNVPNNLGVESGDEVEYTIYYLAEGDAGTIVEANICDPIPVNTTFTPNSNQISRNAAAPTPGGQFFNILQPIPLPSPCPTAQNPNGALVFNLGNLSTANGQNFGYTRFRSRVNEPQP